MIQPFRNNHGQLNDSSHHHPKKWILSLSQATCQVLFGLLIILAPDIHHTPSSYNCISTGSVLDSLSCYGMSSLLSHSPPSTFAEAKPLHETLSMFVRKQRQKIAASLSGTSDSLGDSYSFEAKKKNKDGTAAATKTQSKGHSLRSPNRGFQHQLLQAPSVKHFGTSQNMGQWDLVGLSGVSAMHATLIPNTNKIVFLEKVEKSTNAVQKEDPSLFSWSVEYDIDTASFRSLHTSTNMFCSAGGYRPDGTIVSLGGAEAQARAAEGWNSLRFLSACKATPDSKCDWDIRADLTLKAGRWYPTVETLADGRLFILGGSTRGASMNSKEIGVPSWELYPPMSSNPTHFQFLLDTLPYNLYPMAHLLPDGNLFIFANKQAVLFSTKTWKITKYLPELPGPPRNYPLSGGSVILPLRPENNYEPEILICGGATDFNSHATGQDSCGRIKPLSKDPDWVMEDMPLGRMMPDMTLLPDGTVLILNGANRGTAGYGRAKDPVLQPVLYRPWDDAPTKDDKASSRFKVQSPSYIPRLYHSIALPVLDGRVIVTGSNPNANTLLTSDFPVEYRVEMFSPGYLFSETPRPILRVDQTINKAVQRPGADLTFQTAQNQKLDPERGQGGVKEAHENLIEFDTEFDVEVEFFGENMTEEQVKTVRGSGSSSPSRVQVHLLNSGFVTHSTHMSHRLVGLEVVGYTPSSERGAMDKLKVRGPKDGALTPPGWYQMTVVENGVPSEGVWVHLQARQ